MGADPPPRPARGSVVRRYWRGRGRLGIVFWGYGIGGNGLLAGLLGLLVTRLPGGDDYLWPALLLLGLYNVWVVVSVWRCAYNTRRRYWGDWARLLMVFWTLNLLLLGLFLGLDLVLACPESGVGARTAGSPLPILWPADSNFI